VVDGETRVLRALFSELDPVVWDAEVRRVTAKQAWLHRRRLTIQQELDRLEPGIALDATRARLLRRDPSTAEEARRLEAKLRTMESTVMALKAEVVELTEAIADVEYALRSLARFGTSATFRPLSVDDHAAVFNTSGRPGRAPHAVAEMREVLGVSPYAVDPRAKADDDPEPVMDLTAPARRGRARSREPRS